jgi:hypoxanthine phosphoribosyltransferase
MGNKIIDGRELKVLLSSEQISARVKELGVQITRDFIGKEIAVVGVLKGSAPFLTDLIRSIDHDEMTVDFLGLSSYGHGTKTSGVVKINSDLTLPIGGRDVLVVEDIIDTGLTMKYLLENLATRKPRSIHVCTLLHKPSRKMVDVQIDYVGFTIADNFVIGYGLDYKEQYRNIPYIGHLD